MPGARRVLVLSHMYPHPEQPGSGPFILEQVQALRRAGVDARVVCGRPAYLASLREPRKWLYWIPRIALGFVRYARSLLASRGSWWLHEHVPVRYVPYLVLSGQWSHAWTYRLALRIGCADLRQGFAPEVLHAHTGYLDGSAARSLGRAWGLRYVATEHTGPFSTLMDNPVVRWTTVRALSDAAVLVSVSRALEVEILKHVRTPRGTRVVVPNVVDGDRFQVTRQAPGSADAPRLLFVGFFVPVKNLPLLLDAFELVLAQRPRATLTLVGGGESAADTQAVHGDIARRGLQHAVRVLGFVDRDEVARLMREECDMLVLASRTETFGCVAAEALSSGRPVVATRCGGPEDIVTDDSMGALCENHDPLALATAILRTADKLPAWDPQRLGASARERFGGASVAARLQRIYEGVTRSGGAPAPGGAPRRAAPPGAAE
jgi:glycosyltransferase involved in cell wall biosynthesis